MNRAALAPMRFAMLHSELAGLEAELPRCAAAEAAPALLTLAWHLRQTDAAQALAYAEQAEQTQHFLSPARQQQSSARCALVRSDIALLRGHKETAEQAARQALALFESIADRVGSGDARSLLATIWHEQGDFAQRDADLAAALLDFEAAPDAERVALTRARQLQYLSFRDPQAVELAVAQCFGEEADEAEEDGSDQHEVLSTSVSALRALIAGHKGRPEASTRLFVRSFDAALATGQMRLALVAAGNAASQFVCLGDFEAALEWNGRALALARRAAWPARIAGSLLQIGNALRQLGRWDDATAPLQEALDILSAAPNSNSYGIALQYFGELMLDAGRADLALGYFQRRQQSAQASGEPVLVACRRGQASALSRLGRPAEALLELDLALAQALQDEHAEEQIQVLRIYAEVYAVDSANPLPAPADQSAPSAALHYLLWAQQVAERVPGMQMPPELLSELAQAYAAAGDYKSAYLSAQAAAARRDSKRMQEARDLATALKVRLDNERAHAAAEHHRLRAEQASQRATMLQAASETLEALGLAGREITATLDKQLVFSTLLSHADRLIAATGLQVYLLDPGGKLLSPVFGAAQGRPLPPGLPAIALDHPSSALARCAREQSEFILSQDPEAASSELVSPAAPRCEMLAALLIGPRLLGVIAITLQRPPAEPERALNILRSLCAYAAIALDNAQAYRNAETARQQAQGSLQALRAAQVKLVQAQKLAALGRLVAGVAHELNTPIGNGLMAASTLREQVQLFQQETASKGLRRKAFDEFLAQMQAGADLACTSLERSASLVESFKQLVLEPGSFERQQCDVAELVRRVVSIAAPKLKAANCVVELALPDELLMDSFGEALAAVLSHLLANAIEHGMPAHGPGHLSICGSQTTGENGEPGLRLSLQDNGAGIAAGLHARVFDPFYTSRMGRHSGLGLYFVHNTVVQLLGGSVDLRSQAGAGSMFMLDLPLRAPA